MKLSYFFFLFFICGFGQDSFYPVSEIASDLSSKSNAVVRKNDVVLNIKSYDRVEYTVDRVVTALNEKGFDKNINAYAVYDNQTIVKNIEAVVYDAQGNRVTKIKKGKFRDFAYIPGGTLYSDSRILAMEYTPRSYPLTIHFNATIILKSTAFLPQWKPLEDYYVSTESSSFKIINENHEKSKIYKNLLDEYGVKSNNELSYEVESLKSIAYEQLSPEFSEITPIVKIALEHFKMEGVEGRNSNWKDFGLWMYNDLYNDIKDVPEKVVEEIKFLTKSAKTEREKAEIVYNYVQDRSRYISVQVGIGGWKPIAASDVHRVSYGDCKGLTNYTHTLLNVIGVTSYHCIIYGGNHIRNIDRKFSVTQGNHMMLYIPKLDDEKDIWLECTSKTDPFGYTAGSTDDRDALVITEKGGVIKHTNSYVSGQDITVNSTLDLDGTISGSMVKISDGEYYNKNYSLTTLTQDKVKRFYKYKWKHINKLTILSSNIDVDEVQVELKETIDFIISKYASKSGKRRIIQPVIFDRIEDIPNEYEDRKNNFVIQRSYNYNDNYIINLPNTALTIEAIPDDFVITSEFGEYELRMFKGEENKVIVNRSLKIKKGIFDSSKYAEYRSFIKKIKKADHSKMVLKLD